MSSNVSKSGYVGISADVLTEDPTEKASVKQTIMRCLNCWAKCGQQILFLRSASCRDLKEYRQEQLVLMVYTVSQNTSLEPAHSFQNVHFCYYSYPVQYKKISSLTLSKIQWHRQLWGLGDLQEMWSKVSINEPQRKRSHTQTNTHSLTQVDFVCNGSWMGNSASSGTFSSNKPLKVSGSAWEDHVD